MTPRTATDLDPSAGNAAVAGKSQQPGAGRRNAPGHHRAGLQASHCPSPRRPHDAQRVVIVEGNIDAPDMFRDLLELQGHQVTVAGNGPRGVELVTTERPDVVLVDIGLPGLDTHPVKPVD